MAPSVLFVAIGCGRLPAMLASIANKPFLVFGTMDGQALGPLTGVRGEPAPGCLVYFYESG